VVDAAGNFGPVSIVIPFHQYLAPPECFIYGNQMLVAEMRSGHKMSALAIATFSLFGNT
jgi:hypothetical protein